MCLICQNWVRHGYKYSKKKNKKKSLTKNDLLNYNNITKLCKMS